LPSRENNGLSLRLAQVFGFAKQSGGSLPIGTRVGKGTSEGLFDLMTKITATLN
jgi:hypothetical protein